MITFQAMVISHIDDFKLLMFLSICAMPLVLLLRDAGAFSTGDHGVALE